MLLQVNELQIDFKAKDGSIVRAVEGISFNIKPKETLAIVGESGCGKSVTALSVMRLLKGKGVILRGSILYKNEDILLMSDKRVRQIRGNEISMIFQEPMTSLNPLHKIGDQVAEVIRAHERISKEQAYQRTKEMFELVSIPDIEKRMSSYPFQLSGGLNQRIMIAMALVCRPSLLIADEPTTALDVTIQSQILKQMQFLKEKLNTAIMFITHDLGVVAEIADRVVVMYAGYIMEEAPAAALFANPKHPYTKGLLISIPKMKGKRKLKLPIIKGVVPSPDNKPTGCPFSPRCEKAMNRCEKELPKESILEKNHFVKCWLYH